MTSHIYARGCDDFTCNSYTAWGLSAIFLALFAAVLLVHIGFAAKYKTRFVILLVIAGLLETVAFAIKLAFGQGDDDTPGLWFAWQVPAIIAPFFINAFLYTLLSRLHAHFTPHVPLLNKGQHLLPLLPLLDILPFILQLVGLTLIHLQSSTTLFGTITFFAGFILQLLPLILLLTLLITFHKAANAAHAAGSISLGKSASRYTGLLHALYWSLLFLCVRVIYYTYNAGTGWNWLPQGEPRGRYNGRYSSWVYKNYEPFQLGFDALPILLVLITFAAAHPGRFLRRGEGRPYAGGMRSGWRGLRGLRGEHEERLDVELDVQNDVRRSRGDSGAYRIGYVA